MSRARPAAIRGRLVRPGGMLANLVARAHARALTLPEPAGGGFAVAMRLGPQRP